MKRIVTLWVLMAACCIGTWATDGKEYKTYVKNDRLVYYCNYRGITVVVDITEGGLFQPSINIINETGHEFVFEPKKIKAYSYAVDAYPKERRNLLMRYFDMGFDKSSLVKDSVRVYSADRYLRIRSKAMWWHDLLSEVVASTIDAAVTNNSPESQFVRRIRAEERSEENEATRQAELKCIDENYWRANTIFDNSEHHGFIALKKRKTDHVVLEIPVDGEVFTFLVDSRNFFSD